MSRRVERYGRGELVDYGRWTDEELLREGEYGKVFEALMKQHPETRRNAVGDID